MATILAMQAQALPAKPPLAIGGSSTVYPILQRAIKDYQASGHQGGAPIRLSETGTTAGLREFCNGRLAMANASRPIQARELKACASRGVSFVELPIAFDAITVVVNGKNDWAQMISTKELSRLWSREAEGRIRRWSQVNKDWPDRPIKLCGPGADSGTYDYFNKAINGNESNSRKDYDASEDDLEIAKCVASDRQALAYFGYGYYKANAARLRSLAVVGRQGPVSPAVATVQNGSYAPLSRPLFLYVNAGLLRTDPELRRFAAFVVANGMKLSESAGAIPLPPSTYRLVETKLHKVVLGSSFAGDLPVGLTIGEALRRSFDAERRPEFR